MSARRVLSALAASLVLHGGVLGVLLRGEPVAAPPAQPVLAAPGPGAELVEVAVLGPHVLPEAPAGSRADVRGGASLPGRRAPAAAPRAVPPGRSEARASPPARAPSTSEDSARTGAPPAEAVPGREPSAAPGAPPGPAGQAPAALPPPDTVAKDGAPASAPAPGGAGEGSPGGGPGAAGPGGGRPGGAGPGGPEAGTGRIPEALVARLRQAARRCYPPAAERFRLRGEPWVQFRVSGEGRAEDVRLVRSSGQRLLDAAAVQCVVRGAEPLPALGGPFLVPVSF